MLDYKSEYSKGFAPLEDNAVGQERIPRDPSARCKTPEIERKHVAHKQTVAGPRKNSSPNLNHPTVPQTKTKLHCIIQKLSVRDNKKVITLYIISNLLNFLQSNSNSPSLSNSRSKFAEWLLHKVTEPGNGLMLFFTFHQVSSYIFSPYILHIYFLGT